MYVIKNNRFTIQLLALSLAFMIVMSACGNKEKDESESPNETTPEVVTNDDSLETTDTEIPEEIPAADVEDPGNEPDITSTDDSATAPLITGYNVIRDDRSFTENEIQQMKYFDVVEFYGDETIVGQINSRICDLRDKYFENMEGVDFSEVTKNTTYKKAAFQYSPHILQNVYYDEHILSIGWEMPWYAGGIGNTGYESININLDTCQDITIIDLLGDSVVDILNEAISHTWAAEEASLEKYDLQKTKFHIDETNLYVDFGSYTLGQTTGGSINLVIPRSSIPVDISIDFEDQSDEPNITSTDDSTAFPIITGYDVIRDDRSFTDNGLEVKIYFDVVEFYGDEERLKPVNDRICEIRDQYFEEAEGNVRDFSGAIKGVKDRKGTFQFFPHGIQTVYYDEHTISISWKLPWYAGGVANTHFESINYDMEKCQELTIYDVLGEETYSLLDEALRQTSFSGFATFEDYDISETEFHIDETSVYADFGSHVLQQPTGGTIHLVFPRNTSESAD